MCGIVGYKGSKNAIPILYDGLLALEYRGYDSAGMAFKNENKIEIIKSVGKVNNLQRFIKDKKTNIGMAHTRWATHGGVNECKVGKITIVHNGIIENYLEIKNKLLNNDYSFKSETDTEVLCALIDYIYQQKNNMLETIKEVIKEIKGSYAVIIMCDDDLDSLYALRYNSPLIIAENDNGYYIASDVPAILKYTNKYYLLDQNEIVHIKDSLKIYNLSLKEISKKPLIYEENYSDNAKNGYEHYMLKEINDEPEVINNILEYYITDGKFNKNMPNLKKYKQIYIVGCGSAYYTGEIFKHLYEKYLNIPVVTYLASEYRYQKLFYDQDTLVIFISQSGETADTLEALRKTKKDGIDCLAIVNVYASSLAREADIVLYTKAGNEIAVATTKAFVSQLMVLGLLLIKMANLPIKLDIFNKLQDSLKNIINIDYLQFAQKIYNHKDAFFIGRGVDYGLCEEGSLKLKEISYINSAAFPAGELKHGTISLIEKNTPVLSIISDDILKPKTISNIKEVFSRGAYVLIITNKNIGNDCYNDIIKIPDIDDIVNSILLVVPLQLIAYHVAKLKGEDIDKPRNLAKSVTVE